MRSSVILLLLLFGIGSTAADSDTDRHEAPKAYRYRPIPTGKKIGPFDPRQHDSHSQLAHRSKEMKAEPRIVGGVAAGENTYQFFTRVDTSGYPYCGGSLVASDVVLTAGHCYSDALSVVVNGYDLYSSDGLLQYPRDVDYSKTKRHPDFDATTYDNDALLLKLTSPVTTPYISLNFDDENPQTGDDLTVMGLGNMQEDGAPANTLQAVTVQAVDHDYCEENYREVGLDRVKDDIMLCAGNTVEGGRDACQGDSGRFMNELCAIMIRARVVR